MAQECSCRHDITEVIRAEQTVGDVAQHRAGALEVMKGLGINHCCGGQLTLTEAAASAGVPLGELVAALNALPPGEASHALGGLPKTRRVECRREVASRVESERALSSAGG